MCAPAQSSKAECVHYQIVDWQTLCGAGGYREAEANQSVIPTLLVLAVLSVLDGCNTIEGAGKDVKATGSAVERAADDAKPK